MLASKRMWMAVASVALVGGSVVWADPAATQPSSDSNKVLAGPKADGATTRPHDRGFGGQGRGDKGGLPAELMADLQLTDAQKAQIQPVVAAHMAAAKAWHDAHKDQLDTIRKDIEDAKNSGDKEKGKAAVQKLQDLRKDAPKPKDLVDKIKPFLTPEQIATLDKKEAEMKQKAEERRAQWKKDHPGMMNDGGPRPKHNNAQKTDAGNGNGNLLDT